MLPAPGTHGVNPNNPNDILVPGVDIPDLPNLIVVGELAPQLYGINKDYSTKNKMKKKNGKTGRRELLKWVWPWQGGGASKICGNSIISTITPDNATLAYTNASAIMEDELEGMMEDLFASSTEIECLQGAVVQLFVTLIPLDNQVDVHLACSKFSALGVSLIIYR